MRIRLQVAASLIVSAAMVYPATSADIAAFPYKGGGWFELSGPITQGDTARLRTLILGNGWHTVAIYLDSPGGLAREGVAMGLLAHSMGYTTVVGNRNCTSACALAWAGGAMRLMMPGARVGFHTTYVVDKDGQAVRSESGNGLVVNYAGLIGLPAAAVEMMVKAGPEEVTWISPGLAAIVGLDYHQLDPANDVIPFSQR